LQGGDEKRVVKLAVSCKASYTSLLFLLKMDGGNETGSGLFTRILESDEHKDSINLTIPKGGTYCPTALAAFVQNFRIHQDSLHGMVSPGGYSRLVLWQRV
jgi:hypothetical protein